MRENDTWNIGSLTLRSRVLLGTSRYPDRETLHACIDASGSELITLSMRRLMPNVAPDDLYEIVRARGLHLLPNTAGCFTAKEAELTAELAREALETNLLKLEVIADEETLLPDGAELLIAAKSLVKKGFCVLPYTNDDPVLAERLQDVGCAAVMPLAAPIGTGLGLRNPHNLALIKARSRVPVIVDAGLGTASDVTQAFELGMDAVLLNTAVARAKQPALMAHAVRAAADAGRCAFLAGRMPKRSLAEASSPLSGRIAL